MYWFVTLGVLALVAAAQGHTFHLGRCPFVRYKPSLEISKMMGVWYVIQKTTTGTQCNTYQFSTIAEKNKFKLVQISRNYIFGLHFLGHNIRYSGELTIPDANIASYMTVRFPLSNSVGGSANFVIMATDYNTYALVFTCQNLVFAHRRSASILSRTRDLDGWITSSLRSHLTYSGIEVSDLSIINQMGCPKHHKETRDRTDVGVARKNLRTDLSKEWDFIEDINHQETFIEDYTEKPLDHEEHIDTSDLILRY